MNRTESKVVKIFGILSILGMLIMIGMTVVVSAYTVLVADDFYYAMQVGRNTGALSYLEQCFKYTGNVYMNWQGTYSAEFIAAIFNPVNCGGFGMLRIFMILNVLFFYGSLLTLVYVVVSRIFAVKEGASKEAVSANKAVILVVMALVVFVMAEYDAFSDIFNWYVGATVYSVPFSCGLLALAAFVGWNSGDGDVVVAGARQDVAGVRKKSRWLVVCGCVLGLIAVGGSLAISGTICYFMLVFLLYYWMRDGKVAAGNVVMFGSSFAGSLINAVAPGNFIRQDAESSQGFSVSLALVNTVKVYHENIRWLFTKRTMAMVMILAVVCGFYAVKKSRKVSRAWVVASVLALLTPAVTILPVVMGYNVPWMPNRCVFIAIVAFTLSLINMGLVVGGVICRALSKRSWIKVALVVASLVLVFVSPYSIRSYKSVRHLKALYDHKYQDHYEMVRDLLGELPQRKGEDVVVKVPDSAHEIDNYYTFFLLDDGCWVNRAVAWTYDLKSIRNEGY